MTALRIATLLLATALAGCSRTPAGSTSAAAPAAALDTVAVTTVSVPQTLALTGTLRSPRDSEVAASASGRVVRTFVERGDRLAADVPLVELDLRVSALAADEARANLEAARVEQVRAERDCERNQLLFDKGAITEQERDRANADCRTKAEEVRASTSRLRKAGEFLADAVVRTPFPGIVAERYVNVGEWVQAGAKVAHVVQIDPLRLELTVPEVNLGAVHTGLPVDFEVPALPGRTFQGTVAYVAPSLRPATRDLVFEAVVKNPDGALKPGMFASARLALGTVQLPELPRTALRKEGETVRAFVVKHGKVEERVVELAAAHGDRVAVRAGLAAGDRVVAQATANVSDGMAVR
jgi:membrane fusion protein, multidrug efflux system